MGNEFIIAFFLLCIAALLVIEWAINRFTHSDHGYRYEKQKFYDYMHAMKIDKPEEAFRNCTDLKDANKRLKKVVNGEKD